MSNVKKGDFSQTQIAYHPGVTTMWIAGLRTFFTAPRVNVENLVLARWFIGIVIWIGIGLASLLLYRLFGAWVAVAGVACLAYSPLFLAQTRRVHTDALAATFILLTVLLFLCYCQYRQPRRYLILSGISFGLAFLSKSYALILLPWLPLCLFLFREKRIGSFWRQIAEIFCFLNCCILTVIFLWPVFWTPLFSVMAAILFGITLLLLRNLENQRKMMAILLLSSMSVAIVVFRSVALTVRFVFERVHWAVTTPHEVEHFFFGDILNDPGVFFYPVVLSIKSTPLMLPLALIGCLLLWQQRRHSQKTSRQLQMALSLVAGSVLFTVALSATSKKFIRYLLPAFAMLEILAAIGFVEGLKWSYATLCWHFGTKETNRYTRALVGIVCLCFFFIQVFPVLARHPYYSTYYNLCWRLTDITKVITIGEGSGVDLAAEYLNEKNDATQIHIQASYIACEFLYYYFDGKIHAIRPKQMADSYPNLPIMYEVIYIRDSQIGWAPQKGLKGGKLEHVITLNGIDLVWIYHIANKETL